VFWFYVDDRKTSINTKISHGERELRDVLIGLMAKQVKLTKSDFLRLVECALSAEEYRGKMIAEGHVRLGPSIT
jgi:hypothetical protein